MPLPPRFETSYSTAPLPRSMRFGLITKKSAENSTLPAALRGALSTSAMMRFAGTAGSTAKWIVPAIFSYGPAGPNVIPPARSLRDATSMRTTSAETGAAASAKRSNAFDNLAAVANIAAPFKSDKSGGSGGPGSISDFSFSLPAIQLDCLSRRFIDPLHLPLLDPRDLPNPPDLLDPATYSPHPTYLTAKTQTAPPSGTSGNFPGTRRLRRACMARASIPHPDWTATYCLPPTWNDDGCPMMPELVGNSHSTAPFAASKARKSRSFVPPLKTSPPPVASIGPQFADAANVCVQMRCPVWTFHACTSPMCSAP